MVRPIDNEKVAVLFQAEGTNLTASTPKSVAKDQSSIQTSAEKFDVALAKKTLDSLQKELATLKQAQENNSAISLRDYPNYGSCLASKNGVVVSTDPNLTLSDDGTQAKSYPRTWPNAQSAVNEANKVLKEQKAKADAQVKKLEEEIAALEEKIAKADSDATSQSTEEKEYSFFGCLLIPFTFTWGIMTTVASWVYDLVCCNYGEAEEAATVSEEVIATPPENTQTGTK